MGFMVWYMLLTVEAVELGLGLWDPSGMSGAVYVTNSRGSTVELGLGLWDPSGMSGVVYVTNSRGSRVGTWALGPKWDVWCGICY